MTTFPNYVLKHLASTQQQNILVSLCTVSKMFDPNKIDIWETLLKFLTDTTKFNAGKVLIINLNDNNIAIFAKAHIHPSGKGKQ